MNLKLKTNENTFEFFENVSNLFYTSTKSDYSDEVHGMFSFGSGDPDIDVDAVMESRIDDALDSISRKLRKQITTTSSTLFEGCERLNKIISKGNKNLFNYLSFSYSSIINVFFVKF